MAALDDATRRRHALAFSQLAVSVRWRRERIRSLAALQLLQEKLEAAESLAFSRAADSHAVQAAFWRELQGEEVCRAEAEERASAKTGAGNRSRTRRPNRARGRILLSGRKDRIGSCV